MSITIMNEFMFKSNPMTPRGGGGYCFGSVIDAFDFLR